MTDTAHETDLPDRVRDLEEETRVLSASIDRLKDTSSENEEEIAELKEKQQELIIKVAAMSEMLKGYTEVQIDSKAGRRSMSYWDWTIRAAMGVIVVGALAAVPDWGELINMVLKGFQP